MSIIKLLRLTIIIAGITTAPMITMTNTAEARSLRMLPPQIAVATMVAKAAKGMKNPVTRSAVIRGNQKHRAAFNRSWGQGFQTEHRLPNGRRIDGVDSLRRHVTEVKPNNSRAIARGRVQARAYRDYLENMTGKPWTYSVKTYGRRR
jgi:Restriction endonuclease fold toxin 9